MNAFIPYGSYWSSPFAKWQGRLSSLNPLQLVAATARSAIDAGRFTKETIDLAILGLTNPYPGSFYGLPYVTGMMGLGEIAGPTVQQACATSVRALQMAAQEIADGTARCALLLMADKQSNGPVLYYPDPEGPGGYGRTERWVPDNMAHDPYTGAGTLATAENVARRFGITTAEQHEVKLHRHAQYETALADDRAFQRRYMIDVPLTDRSGRKSIGSVTADEGIFPTTAEGLARLKPLQEDGTVTYGGQTYPADGNAGMIVTTRALAREISREPGIEIELLSFGMGRVERGFMPMAPVPATRRALARAGLSMAQLDAVKTHNPFAVNDIVLARETGFDWKRMNNFGSSLIWGHPQAPTGARGVIELIEELVLRGGGVGLFTGCAAGDTGMSLILRVRDARPAH
jgi:acetyl-CoA acetyltransferase